MHFLQTLTWIALTCLPTYLLTWPPSHLAASSSRTSASSFLSRSSARGNTTPTSFHFPYLHIVQCVFVTKLQAGSMQSSLNTRTHAGNILSLSVTDKLVIPAQCCQSARIYQGRCKVRTEVVCGNLSPAYLGRFLCARLTPRVGGRWGGIAGCLVTSCTRPLLSYSVIECMGTLPCCSYREKKM